jgi:hypothetical protein
MHAYFKRARCKKMVSQPNCPHGVMAGVRKEHVPKYMKNVHIKQSGNAIDEYCIQTERVDHFVNDDASAAS